MKISLDYDYTYTRDPELWNQFIKMFQSKGHEVYCITYRHYHELREVHDSIGKVIPYENVIATGRTSKLDFTRKNHDLFIDVWIDDEPFTILHDLEITPPEILHKCQPHNVPQKGN